MFIYFPTYYLHTPFMFDVVTIGGATSDIFIKCKDSKVISIRESDYQREFLAYEYGKKIYVDQIIYSPGGGGNNTAVSFARLGLRTAFVGCVGQDDEGRRLLMNLKSEGIRTDFVTRVADQSTGLSVILNSFEGDRTVFSHRGANNSLTKDVIKWEELKQTKWLYLPSLSAQSEHLLPDVISFAQKNGVKIACNPGSVELKRGMKGLDFLLKYCDILVLNKEEGEILTGLRARHRVIEPEDDIPLELMRGEPWISDVREIMATLHKQGVGTVVVTEGIKGAQAYDGEHYYWMPVLPYEPIDTLGAGDAFASSFVAGRILDKSVAESLQMAAANASLVVQKFGAQPGLGTLEQVHDLLAKHDTFHIVRENTSDKILHFSE